MDWRKERLVQKERIEKAIERALSRIPKDEGKGPFYTNRAEKRRRVR